MRVVLLYVGSHNEDFTVKQLNFNIFSSLERKAMKGHKLKIQATVVPVLLYDCKL